MPCYKPLTAWRTTENTSTGKKKIAFVKSPQTTTRLTLPCNQCIGCKLDRSLVWATRCVHEAQLHQQNSFITLTYAPEHLPWDGSLSKSHFQKFIKRLRKHLYPQTIRYFMAGEYGEKFSRPHYHACLFGVDFPDKDPIRECEGIILYNSPTLDDIWGKGYTTLGDVTFETAAYTARYITKKITGDQANQHYQTTCAHTGNLITLEPEYTAMSLKPGIGADWLEKYETDVYPSDFIIHRGKKIKVPRYYDKIMELRGEDLETIKKLRKKNAARFKEDTTPERLAVREHLKLLKFKQLSRSYENQ